MAGTGLVQNHLGTSQLDMDSKQWHQTVIGNTPMSNNSIA